MRYECSDFRITKNKKGFLVEKQIFRWTLFGLKIKWVHFISFSRLYDQPYYFETFDIALETMLKEIRWEVISDYSI